MAVYYKCKRAEWTIGDVEVMSELEVLVITCVDIRKTLRTITW